MCVRACTARENDRCPWCSEWRALSTIGAIKGLVAHAKSQHNSALGDVFKGTVSFADMSDTGSPPMSAEECRSKYTVAPTQTAALRDNKPFFLSKKAFLSAATLKAMIPVGDNDA